MGRRGFPPEIRCKVLDLAAAGRPVADIARDLQISAETVYTWQRQGRIGRGLADRRHRPPAGRDGQRGLYVPTPGQGWGSTMMSQMAMLCSAAATMVAAWNTSWNPNHRRSRTGRRMPYPMAPSV